MVYMKLPNNYHVAIIIMRVKFAIERPLKGRTTHTVHERFD